jgi:hypothetical protein
MTSKQHRPSVSDRARRRAIRALAAQLGVSYMVASRLLTGEVADQHGAAAGGHRASLFALREQRPFDVRVRDTRLAADVPLGRPTHLTERFPPLRGVRQGPFYDGEGRQSLLSMLYAVVAHESPAVLPTVEELEWVAGLGEEIAVDVSCAALDRAARLLLDGDRWRLWTRIEATLTAGAASTDQRARDAAVTLDRVFRTVILRRSLDGVRHILDALLVTAWEGHAPGTRVRVVTGPHAGRVGTVVGAGWRLSGPPTGYEVHLDTDPSTSTVDPDALTLE